MVFKSAQEQAIGTSSTTVLTGDGDAGNYLVYLYLRMLGTATVTATVTWTDATGAQVETPLDASYDAGSISLDPLYLNAALAGNATVAATSSVANTAYLSASIKRL